MKTILTLLSLATLAISAQAFAGDTKAPNNPHAGMSMPGANAYLTQQGVVTNVINVPQYTYLEVRQGKDSRWLATTTVAVKKGDMVRFEDGMMMTNFYSKSLKRTFDKVSFVSRIVVSKAK